MFLIQILQFLIKAVIYVIKVFWKIISTLFQITILIVGIFALFSLPPVWIIIILLILNKNNEL